MKAIISVDATIFIAKLIREINKTDSKKERGGLLYAKVIDAGYIRIERITEFANEIQTDNFYERSFSEGEFLDLLGISYNPFKTIVGYWHTHPDGNHTASKIDDYSMFEKANSLNCFFGLWKGRVLSLIISKNGFNLYMYRGKKRYLLKSLNV